MLSSKAFRLSGVYRCAVTPRIVRLRPFRTTPCDHHRPCFVAIVDASNSRLWVCDPLMWHPNTLFGMCPRAHRHRRSTHRLIGCVRTLLSLTQSRIEQSAGLPETIVAMLQLSQIPFGSSLCLVLAHASIAASLDAYSTKADTLPRSKITASHHNLPRDKGDNNKSWFDQRLSTGTKKGTALIIAIAIVLVCLISLATFIVVRKRKKQKLANQPALPSADAAYAGNC